MSIGLIITVCLASSPACEPADGRTCQEMFVGKSRLCHVVWEPVTVTEGQSEEAALKQCGRFSQMYLAKPGGWLDEHPDLKIKGVRCGYEVDFKKKVQREA